MRPASRHVSIRLRYAGRAKDKVKISEFESIVSRPLKTAEGGAASVGSWDVQFRTSIIDFEH
jgi:hypothetical protein